MDDVITPTCRYGHGELMRVSVKGLSPEWSLLSPAIREASFNVALFTCNTCGYSELFDREPLATKEMEASQ